MRLSIVTLQNWKFNAIRSDRIRLLMTSFNLLRVLCVGVASEINIGIERNLCL